MRLQIQPNPKPCPVDKISQLPIYVASSADIFKMVNPSIHSNLLPLKTIRSLLIIICLLISPQAIHAQSLYISEVMPSNNKTISDDDGDSSDWIELYNPGPDTIHLKGYGLSDTYNHPFKWVFPDISIGQNKYLLIWASGKNRRDTNSPLHSNFKISSKGEIITLTSPLRIGIDILRTTPSVPDISFGRKPGETSQVYLFKPATPGESNNGKGYSGILPPVTFSRAAGFYPQEFQLLLQHDDKSAKIHYTFDGSVPSGSSNLYQSALAVNDRSQAPNFLARINTTRHFEKFYKPQYPVFKGTIIKARAFKTGYLPSPTATRTYFVHKDILSRFTLPVFSLVTDPDNLFSGDRGIYCTGDNYDGKNMETTNFYQKGKDWERPVHIELFEPDGTLAISQNGGVRIHGHRSALEAVKSLRLYARKQYGKAYFHYKFFPYLTIDRYKRILLRNGGNEVFNSLLRDGLNHNLVRHLDLAVQAYRPAIVFLNGEYWGIHNIRERFDEHYLYAHYGAAPSNVDITKLIRKNCDSADDACSDLLDLTNYIIHQNPNNPLYYSHVNTQMDIDNLFNYLATEIYIANSDWPRANTQLWRVKPYTYNFYSQHDDGRWRWRLFDTDRSLGRRKKSNGYQKNSFKRAMSRLPLLASLMANQEFKARFLNRFADLLNTTFKPERIIALVNSMRGVLAPEIKEHARRYRQFDIDNWEKSLKKIKEFAVHRPEFIRHHLVKDLGLSGLATLSIGRKGKGKGKVQVNSLLIDSATVGIDDKPYPWKGIYFKDISIKLIALPDPGHRFAGWFGDICGIDDETYTISMEGDLNIVAHFVPNS